EIARQGAPLYHALHGRSRTPRRSHRRDRSRPRGRRRYALRDAAAGSSRRGRRAGVSRGRIFVVDRKEPARLMALTQILAMVRKDLKVHYSDRRAVIMSFVAPIAIASFLGAITGGSGSSGEPAKIPIAMVDQDASTVTKAIVAAVAADQPLQVTMPTAEPARESVKRGDVTVAVIIPAGFGEASGLAFFGGAAKPDVSVLYDPSHRAEMALVRGLMTQHVMEAISREMFGGGSGRQLAEQALLNLDKSGMPESQRALLGELLGSVQKFYAEPPETDGRARPGGITLPYSVSEEAV